MPDPGFTLNHRITEAGTIVLIETDGARRVVMIHLGIERPVHAAFELLLATLPHFTDSDVIGQIRLHVDKRTTLDEGILR